MAVDLDLDIVDLSKAMAISLAVLHWQAQVDGMDVEFVLGSARATLSDTRRAFEIPAGLPILPPPHEVHHHLDFMKRAIHIWVLDFDKADPIQLSPTDVDKKLVPAFLGNDPYYPRPDVDEELWAEFSAAYLKASLLILERRQKKRSVLGLPKRFLEKVAEIIQLQQDWDPEEQILFQD